MCVEIYLPESKRRIETIDALRGFVHPVKVTILDGYGAVSGDCCLCPVDVEATAKAAGYVVEDDPDGDCMSPRWRKVR